MNLHHKLLYVAMALVLAPGTLLAADQDATSQNPSSQNPIAANKKVKDLDTISVTATKRETPLQKTPVAVTAISADTLDKERVMTVQDVSAYLRVHPSTVYRLLKRNELPAFRVGSDWRFNVEAIDRWRSQMEAGAHVLDK